MEIEGRAGVLLALVVGVVYGLTDPHHCTKYTEYNTLANLEKHDNCISAESVFKLLTEIGLKDDVGGCRNHLVHQLADHYGDHSHTPDNCQCLGDFKLLEYHTGPGDDITDHKHDCKNNNAPYRDMYHQYFKSSRRNSHVTACMMHHTVWSRLEDIKDAHDRHNFCEKDIVFHIKYAFEHHPANCTCTEVKPRTHGNTGHGSYNCHHFESYNKLSQLGETDGCLSANSAWHYLDDLQVQSPECRKKIQHHLAIRYRHAASQGDVNCTCNERMELVNQKIHRMSNGSLTPCLNENGTYSVIEADLFSNIRTHGCQNHKYLWPKLEGINNHCKWDNGHHCAKETDCTEDLIVRAAVQYPTDESDSCVCTKASSSVASTTFASKRPSQVVTSTVSSSESSASSVTSPSTTSVTQIVSNSSQSVTSSSPSVTSSSPSVTTSSPSVINSSPRVTSSSPSVTQTSTVMSTQQTVPTIKFACNKVSVVEKIAKSLTATHPNSSACKSNAGGTDDAFLLSTCNMTSPLTWRKGANVMADCKSSIHYIPPYTPISTFNSDSYNPIGDQAGMFLACYGNNGIKIAIQKCNGVAEIVHIETGTSAYNPNNYYLIV